MENNKVLAQRLKEVRLEKNITQDMLAKSVGFHKSTIQRYESGAINNIKLPIIETISSYLGVNPVWLIGESEEKYLNNTKKIIKNIMPIETKKFPLLGNIACGEPIYASEDFNGYVEAGADIKADFCLKAKGDSMIGARIQDGDIVFIKKQEMVNNGEIAAVLIEDEATLKRVDYDKENNIIRLFAENPTYKTMIYENEELDQIRILGKAVAFQSDIK